MKKNYLKEIALSSIATLAFPMLALAAPTFSALILQIQGWLTSIITLLFVLVTLYFIWGVVQYVKAAGDDKAIATGKQHMIYGVIGMAVMAAVWGIVNVLVQSFGVGGGTIPTTGL
jgi:hypothetical protein